MENMSEIKRHFEDEANEYDQIIIKLIPYYKEMIDALISSIPHTKKTTMQVLDLGCGTGTISHNIKKQFPRAEFSLVDISTNMLELAQYKIGEKSIISCENRNFYDFTFQIKYDVIVSSLALHHLVTDQDKQEFYRKIYLALNPGGVFFNADVVLASTDFLQKVYLEKWIRYMNRECSLDEIHNKWMVNYRNEDRPAVLQDQIKWLETIGFSHTDIIWKYYNFAVYGGYKNGERNEV